jgi:hypothetical protein
LAEDHSESFDITTKQRARRSMMRSANLDQEFAAHIRRSNRRGATRSLEIQTYNDHAVLGDSTIGATINASQCAASLSLLKTEIPTEVL